MTEAAEALRARALAELRTLAAAIEAGQAVPLNVHLSEPHCFTSRGPRPPDVRTLAIVYRCAPAAKP